MKKIAFLIILILPALYNAQNPCFANAPSWYLGGNTGLNFRNSIGTCNKLDLILKTNDTSRVLIKADGRMVFGKKEILSSHPHANSPFQFDGKIACKELVVVDPNKWADFVFDNQYKPMPLGTLEKYYLLHKHLPNIPSEADVKANGIKLAEMDALLLQKIEELTLYVVDINKQVDSLKKENANLKAVINKK